jgi:peptidyl-dipeptidase Dcp
LREEAFRAWIARGEQPERDNRPIIRETVALRDERAKLLGYPDFAAFKLDDSMAKNPDNVRKLLDQVWEPARRTALEERDRLQTMAQSIGDNIEIRAWDWRYYAEKVRAADYALDDAETKPYFPLQSMIEAAFDVANRLFGLQFSAREDVVPYHPDVRVFEVLDAQGGHVGLFLGDYFARSGKRSGAWMSGFRSQHRLKGDVRPIIVNVMNFAKGNPTLLSFDDARTLFHEFGHALHGLLSDVTYPMISGTAVARDFVELPSQLYEHWLMTPEILKRHARHVDTGEPIPDDMIERIIAARNFNQGFAASEFIASAMADIDIHTSPDPSTIDADAAEAATREKLDAPGEIVLRHRLPHFAHIFSGDGYAAGYYSYLWSEVMDADAFSAFEETGDVFDPETAARLKEFVYSAGNRQDAADAYTAFRGAMPSVEPLLEKRGFAKKAA